MSIVSPVIKTTFAKREADLRAAAGPVVTTNTAVARVIENQHSEATVRGMTLVQDEPASVSGTGKGPTPTDFFVASIAFCENVIFARTAATSDLDIEALETAVSGEWDQRGLFEIGGATSGFSRMRVETRVTTRGPDTLAAEVARATHRRCPVYQTLKPAMDLVFTLVVNGREVAL
jgi:uncharacterized OsmC-like protein